MLCRFLDAIELAYAAADVVVSRAGAMTCTEILTTGKPSILVLHFDVILFYLNYKNILQTAKMSYNMQMFYITCIRGSNIIIFVKTSLLICSEPPS